MIRKIVWFCVLFAISTALSCGTQASYQKAQSELSRIKTAVKKRLPKEMPQPWGAMIEEVVDANPWYGEYGGNYAGGSNPNYLIDVITILKSAPTDMVIAFLEHRVRYVRMAVHTVLGERRYKDKDIIKKAYEEGSPRIKLELMAYVDEGPKQPSEFTVLAMKYLSKILEDPYQPVYANDARYLFEINSFNMKDYPIDPVAFYIRLAESEFILDRLQAIDEFAKFRKEGDRIVPLLAGFLNAPDEYPPKLRGSREIKSQRAASAWMLGYFRSNASEIIPYLKKAMDDPDMKVRYYASSSLYLLGYKPEEQRKFLENQFTTEGSAENLATLTECVGRLKIKPPGENNPAGTVEFNDESTAKLVELTRSDDENVRGKAMLAIELSRGSDFAMSVCMSNLNDPNYMVRRQAVYTADKYSTNKKAREVLNEALINDDPNIKFMACDLLLNHGVSKSMILPYLIEVTQSDKPVYNVITLINRLKQYGPDARDAIPGLLKLMATTHSVNSDMIIDLAENIGGFTKEIIDELTEMVKSDKPGISNYALEKLGGFGREALGSIPAIIDCYESAPEGYVQTEFGRSINLKISSERALIQIIKSLSPDDEIPESVLQRLLKIQTSGEIHDFASSRLSKKAADKD